MTSKSADHGRFWERNPGPGTAKTVGGAGQYGSLAEPVEIAKHVTYLCSEFNTYLTGQTITLDGGLSARF
jgi:NAD(P)-dependent dehydrogenase (short-subunit alcohol dehydrogenase family)